MTISARDIDHLALILSDPEAVAGHLKQLGFNLTPEGVEPRCVCFQAAHDDVPNYMELLQGDPESIALALNVAELAGEKRTHVWETDDGLTVDAEVVVGVGEVAGPLPWFPVRHETPDAFMEPEWIVHPNGALGLSAIHAVAEDPPAIASALAEAWRAEREQIFDGCDVVKTGSVELLVWSPQAWQLEYKPLEVMAPAALPAIVGITVGVERSRPLQALLRANNVPFALTDDGHVLVAPEQTGALMIEFLPQA